MATVSEENSTAERAKSDKRSEKSNYWQRVVSHYEKRNASLERKQADLMERVRFMECALPSLLVGAVVGAKRGPEPSKKKLSSCSHVTSDQSAPCTSSCASHKAMSLLESIETGTKIEDPHPSQTQSEAKP